MAEFPGGIPLLYLKGQCILLPLMLVIRFGLKNTINSKTIWNTYRGILVFSLIIPLFMAIQPDFTGPIQITLSTPVEESISRREISTPDNPLKNVIIENPLFVVKQTILLPESAAKTTFFFTVLQADIPMLAGIVLLLISLPGLCLFIFRLIQQKNIEDNLEKKALRIRRLGKLKIIYSQSVIVPFTSGINRFSIFLPESMLKKTRSMAAILRHEVCHIRENHLMWNTLGSIHRYLFWYNPLAHYIHRAGELVQECICDQAAVRDKNVIPYVKTLAAAAEHYLENHKKLAFAASFNPPKLLLRRIAIMKYYINNTPKKPFISTALAAVLSGILFLLANTTAFAQEDSYFEDLEKATIFIKNNLPAQDQAIEAYKDSSGLVVITKDYSLPHPITGIENTITLKNESAPFIWPIKEGTGRVTQPWGERIHPLYQKPFFHLGIDISTGRSGPEIVSVQDGVVVETGNDPEGVGLYILIEHENNLKTMYSHLKSISVTKGAAVIQGDTIGILGNTGKSTGPHLELRITYYGLPVKPDAFIGL